jgi:hypothetical protein
MQGRFGLVDRLISGTVRPFTFRVGGDPAKLEFQNARQSGTPERRTITQVWLCADQPLIVTADCLHVAAHDLLTCRVRLTATGAVSAPVDEVEILELPIEMEGEPELLGWNGGFLWRSREASHVHGVFPL